MIIYITRFYDCSVWVGSGCFEVLGCAHVEVMARLVGKMAVIERAKHRGKVGPLWNLVGALCHYLIIWLIRIVWNPELANLDFRVTQPTMGHTGIS